MTTKGLPLVKSHREFCSVFLQKVGERSIQESGYKVVTSKVQGAARLKYLSGKENAFTQVLWLQNNQDKTH